LFALRLGGQTFLVEFAVAGVIGFRAFQLCLVAFEIRFGLPQLGGIAGERGLRLEQSLPVGARVDFEQQRVLLYVSAFGERDAHDLPGYLRSDLNYRRRLHSTDGVNLDWYRFLNHGSDTDRHHGNHSRGGFGRAFGFLLAAGAGEQRNSRQNNGRHRRPQVHYVTPV
jgi:hypothetical protein